MPNFGYVAKNTSGELVRATVEAPSRVAALMALRKKGLTVVKLDAPEEAFGGAAEEERVARSRPLPRLAKSGLPILRRRVKLSDISDFCRLLATSVNAGIPLRDAVEAIAQDVDNPNLRHVLGRLVKDMYEGQSFSHALARFPDVFGSVFISLVESAEESGSMPDTLTQLAMYLERAERIRRKIQSVLAYPIFVLLFFFLVCVIMTVFVIPRFQNVFEGLGARLPMLTTIVFDTNTFILTNILYILIGALALIVLFVLFKGTASGRHRVDAWKLKVPVIGPILQKYAVARVSRSLAVMVQGGVPVTTAIEIASVITGNSVMRKSLLAARDRIMAGSDIAGSLRGDPHFPNLFVRMVSVGEGSGRLPDVLAKLADVYEEQVEGQIVVATALMEPIIICVFGALVLVLILAIYMPVFTVASKV
ncbi:MAG: type II secretion system F family protein [Candidatus Pacebacteria bacterium]|nr:type II secretion system F family protein [Candidatus Paceibacterota bacterium]